MDGLPLEPGTQSGEPTFGEPSKETPANVDTVDTLVFLESTQLAFEVSGVPSPQILPEAPGTPPLHRTSKGPEKEEDEQHQVAEVEENQVVKEDQVEEASGTKEVPPPIEPSTPEIPAAQRSPVSPLEERVLSSNSDFSLQFRCLKPSCNGSTSQRLLLLNHLEYVNLTPPW